MAIGVCLLSGSRGPLLASLALLAVVAAFSSRRWWVVPMASVIGLAAAWAVLNHFWPAELQRVYSLGDISQALSSGSAIGEVSAGTRQAFYSASWEAFQHSPWIGYGWANKMQAIVPYLPGDGAALVAPHRHLHSDLLDFAVSGGVVGLIVYGLLLAAPIIGAYRSVRDGQRRARLLGVILLAVCYFACGLTYLMFGYEFHTTLFVCLAAILLGYCRDAPSAGASDPRPVVQ